MQGNIIKVNEISLYVETKGTGVPLVLCHGGPGSFDYLGPVADMVNDLCHVIRYDQRGSWRSEAKEPYNVETFLNDLDNLRIQLGLDTWIVGGHSWGAGLALAYAAKYKSNVNGLIYISGTGINQDWHDDYRVNRLNNLSREKREEYINLRSIEHMLIGEERIHAVHRIRELSLQADLYYKNNKNKLPRLDGHFMNKEVNQKLGEDWNSIIKIREFRDSINQIVPPTLILHGEYDPRPSKYAIELANSIPSGEYDVIPNAGHYPWIDQPTIFKRVTRKFLKKII